jgi:signal transduction histidine kinase
MLGAGALVVLGVRTILLNQLNARIESALVQESEEFRRFLQRGRDEAGRTVGGRLALAGRLYLQRTVLDQGEAIVVLPATSGPVATLGAPYALGADPGLRTRWLAATRAGIETITTPGGEAIVLNVPVRQGDTRLGSFVVANFVAAERAEVDDALLVVAQVTGGAVLLVALIAWSVAGRVLRPLRRMTDTARRISEEDLSRRLDDPGGHDEVSELVRTFNRMMDRLEGAMDTQRAFLADAGHDLRTPLTIVRGHLDQLRSGLVPEAERAETLDLVGDELRRMSRLVDDLMLLARSQMPDFLHLAPVDLADLAEGVVRRAQALPGPAWRARPGVGVVTADAERLTQAALNLVSNAARYSPPGEPVTIATTVDGHEAVLSVSDSGPGIPAADRVRLTERFVRGPERGRSGTGLGLAIVRAIAEAHGGRLAVTRAVPEGGARFEIRIPTRGGG